MTNFPDNVLEMFFDKLKPSEVLRLRLVSKTWGDKIESRFEKLKIWQKLCHDDHEIKPWIFKIVEKRFPRAKKNWNVPLYQHIWKKIFFSYNQWRMIKSFSYLQSRLRVVKPISRDEITCIDVWANYIAVGTKNGRMIIYNNNTGFKTHCESKYHFFSITQIKFWYTETKDLIAVIQMHKLLGYSRLKYWDVKNLRAISNPFTDENVENYTCNSHRLFIATSYVINEMKWNDGKLTMGQAIEFVDLLDALSSRLRIYAICDDPNRLSVIVNNKEEIARVFILKIPSADRSQFIPLYHSLSSPLMGPITTITCYSPLPGIAMFSNDKLISTNLSHEALEIAPRPILDLIRGCSFLPKLKISSMLLHCNILFFGLKTGQVVLYFCRNSQNLISLDFENLPTRTIDVCHDPIIHLNIIQITEVLYLFAVTKTKLHFVQFIDQVVPYKINESM